jgi:hypothetical protein
VTPVSERTSRERVSLLAQGVLQYENLNVPGLEQMTNALYAANGQAAPPKGLVPGLTSFLPADALGTSEPPKQGPIFDSWMEKAKKGEFASQGLGLDRLLAGEHEKVGERNEKVYRDKCVNLAGFTDLPKYLNVDELDLVRDQIWRKAPSLWVDGGARTVVVGFNHDMVMRGGPIRKAPHRLPPGDAELLEKMITDELLRGQLTRMRSPWGSAAFLTKPARSGRAEKKRRMVVDYRFVNAVTVRSFFTVPRADDQKRAVAGNLFFTLGDGVSGFNQLANTEEAMIILAVVSISGTYGPRCLTFGPTNGPEDFQCCVNRMFGRRLGREWNLFIDDATVATGKNRPDEEKDEHLAEDKEIYNAWEKAQPKAPPKAAENENPTSA